jgi:hypothetical protein
MINDNEQTQTGDHSSSIPTGSLPPETGEYLTNRYIAYCGIDCTVCPRYKNDCPEGCLGSNPANDCGLCAVRRCSLEKQIDNCAYCEKYPCEILENQYENMSADGYGAWAITSKTILNSIRKI